MQLDSIKMQYRQDKKSGNQLSVLGMGCMRFPSSKEKTEEILLKAIENGINYFDTAYIYHGSEEILGEIFEKHHLRKQIYIATKLPQAMCKQARDFDRFFDIQKKRLRTDYIDYYHMHNFTDFAQWQHLCNLGIEDWIKKKQNSGEIKQIGFSFHGTNDEFKKIIDAYAWDFVLIQYNYININYQAGVEGIKYAHEKGMPVFIMEPLLGGKLASLPKKAQAVLKSDAPDTTGASLALRWIWAQEEITLLLSGMNHMSQLEENILLAKTALPNSLSKIEHGAIEKIKDIFNKSYKIPCTGCNYCLPCPKKLNIPAFFEAYNNSYAIGYYTGMHQYILSMGSFNKENNYASNCIKCGICEIKCPQHINIQKKLKSVKKRFHFPGMKLVLKIVKKRMSK